MMKIKKSILLCLATVFSIQISTAAQKIIPGAQAITYGNNQFLILAAGTQKYGSQAFFTDAKGNWTTTQIYQAPPQGASPENFTVAIYGAGRGPSSSVALYPEFFAFSQSIPLIYDFADDQVGEPGWTRNYVQFNTMPDDFRSAAYDGNGTVIALMRSGFPNIPDSSSFISMNNAFLYAKDFSPLYNAVTFGQVAGKTTLVAVGEQGVIGSSNNYDTPDFSVQPNSTLLSPETLQAVAYGNGIFVAVGDQGVIETSNSKDFNTWAIETPPSIVNFKAVSYGNNRWVAVGSSPVINKPTIMYSNDGANWNSANYYTNMVAIAYGNGEFMAINTDGAILVSTDGANWTDAL